ncbi:MAG: hypothetical protein E6I66_10370 [Chloroflexi bacterium]|nr:MAG: hypothetical protein E6I66_10370 [Chloroflexota bacterium]
MSNNGFSRRSALQKLAKLGGTGVVVSVFGLVPEVRALAGSQQPTLAAANTQATDPRIRRLIDRAKTSSEWNRFRAALVSEEPFGVVSAPSGRTLLAFSLWDTDPVATEARRVEPFQALRALAFGFAPGGESGGAVLMTPSADYTSTTIQDLRSSAVQTARHSASAQAAVARARAKAIEIKSTRMAIDGRALSVKAGPFALAATGCNCGTNRLYSCDQVITGGGYWDDGCLAGCAIGCGYFGGGWAFCFAVCYAACWVLPYSYCASYSCTMCAW